MWLVLCAFVIPSVFCALLGLYLCIYQTRMAPIRRDESAHLLYSTKRQPPSPPSALMNFSLPSAASVRRFCPIGPPPAHCYSNWQLPSPILPPPAYSENPILPWAFETDQIFDHRTQLQLMSRRPTLCAIAMPNNF